jgi:hypothetical protein
MSPPVASVALTTEHHVEVVFLGNAHFTVYERWTENDYNTIKVVYEASPSEYLAEVDNTLEEILGKKVENVQVQFDGENLITTTTYTVIKFATSLRTEGLFKTMEYPYLTADVLKISVPGRFVRAGAEPDERGDRWGVWRDLTSLPWVKFDISEMDKLVIQVGPDGSARVAGETKYWYSDVYNSARTWITANEATVKQELRSDIELRWSGGENLIFDWDDANRTFRSSWVVLHFASKKELTWVTKAVERESPLDIVELEIPEGMEIKKAEGATIFKNTSKWENIIDIPPVEYGEPSGLFLWLLIVAGTIAFFMGIILIKLLKRM